MPTREQRREVARKLRENATAHPEMALVLNVAFSDDTLKPDGAMEWEVTSHDAAMRLADLIDPDCTDEVFCSVCGDIIPEGWCGFLKCGMDANRD